MRIPKLKEKLIYCGIILAVIGVMYFFKIPCLFKLLLKIECPGCGMTRAYISLLHLDIKKAFAYNAMFWAVPVCFVFYLFDDKIFKKQWINDVILYAVYLGLFANWIIRLIAS